MAQNRPNREQDENTQVIQIRRVSKKTSGGNNVTFTALVVTGDKQGMVGVGLGKAPTVVAAIKKAGRLARRDMVKVPMVSGTIPFAVTQKFKAANVLLKPAPAGTGIIAGGAVRVVVEAAGINDIVSKIIGTRNRASNVYATLEALKNLKPRLSNNVGVPRVDPEQGRRAQPANKKRKNQ